jgi:hypothetical protein
MQRITRTLTREELYALVWSEPIQKLSKRCGVHCRITADKLNVTSLSAIRARRHNVERTGVSFRPLSVANSDVRRFSGPG